MVEAGGVEPPAPSNIDGSSLHADSRQHSQDTDLLAELQEVVAAWTHLSPPLKAAVLAIVRAAERGAP